MTYNFILIN